MTFIRHASPKRCSTAALVGLTWLLHNVANGAPQTAPEVIIGSAEGFLEFMVEDYIAQQEIPGRYEIRVNSLDPRLRLAACDRDLTQSLESPKQPIGRVTVRVSCPGSTPWTLFVPAQVQLFRPVATLRHSLKRDSVISSADLLMQEHDIGSLTRGYLTEPAQIIGKKLTRNVQPNQVLTPTMLQASDAIRRGDQVVINARSGGINVRMQGEALSNGSLGQQINVRNLSSQRVLRARVSAPGQVDVEM